MEKRRIVKSGANAGKEQWDTLGYYSNLRTAADCLLKKEINSLLPKEAIKDIKTLIAAIDEGADLIARACAEAIPKIKERETKRAPVTSGGEDASSD